MLRNVSRKSHQTKEVEEVEAEEERKKIEHSPIVLDPFISLVIDNKVEWKMFHFGN